MSNTDNNCCGSSCDKVFFPAAVAENLVSYVEYADGSIVSKTLYDSPHCTLTIFAFDKDQNLSEHVAPFDAFVQVLDGEVEVLVDGKPYRAKAGELVLMPANIPHAVKAISKFKMLLTLLS